MSDKESNFSEYLTTLSERIEAGEYIYPEELAHSMTNAENGLVPDVVRRYIIATLYGYKKRPPGRRPLMLVERFKKNLQLVIFANCYVELLKQRPGGTMNFAKCIRDADFWNKSAYTMAMMMIARKYKGDSSKWETIRNIVEDHPATALIRKRIAEVKKAQEQF